MRTPLIEFRDVTKRFGSKTILDRINLQIYENQITTIIGKSGTGKSVLLKHIIGLLQPDEGVILFNGAPVNDMKLGDWDRYRSHISYLFQDNALFDSMTVFENGALPLKETTNLGKREIAQRVMTRVEQTELTEVADKYPSELSGGMQKRVALARALVTDPQIVLFDEPTTGPGPHPQERDPQYDRPLPQMAVEVLRLLGEYTNNHFGPLGGFSARHSRSQILTVLPRISLIEAQEMVDSFAQTLNDAALSRIESFAQSRIGGDACSEILVQAGITGVVANDDIDHIIQKAVANQRVVATFRCESGGNQP